MLESIKKTRDRLAAERDRLTKEIEDLETTLRILEEYESQSKEEVNAHDNRN